MPGNCIRCGAKIKGKPIRTLVAKNSVVQTARVQFRRRVDVTVNGENMTFFPAQIIAVSFSILKTILDDKSDSARFLSAAEKAEFFMVYPEMEELIA